MQCLLVNDIQLQWSLGLPIIESLAGMSSRGKAANFGFGFHRHRSQKQELIRKAFT
jgi:hypothetical protein